MAKAHNKVTDYRCELNSWIRFTRAAATLLEARSHVLDPGGNTLRSTGEPIHEVTSNRSARQPPCPFSRAMGSFNRHFKTVAHRGSAVTGSNAGSPLSGSGEETEFEAAKSSDRHMVNIPPLPFGSTFDCIGLEGRRLSAARSLIVSSRSLQPVSGVSENADGCLWRGDIQSSNLRIGPISAVLDF